MKITVTKQVPGAYLDWKGGDTSISDMRKDLDKIEKFGATHVRIDYEYSHGDTYIILEALHIREETDEEYAERIKQEEHDKERLKQHELAQLEALKKKYGL